jgi:PAS domain S-box-containing protein
LTESGAYPSLAPAPPAAPRFTPSASAAVAVAIGLVGASVVVRFALQRWLGSTVPFLQFFPAIMIAAWYGGFRAGLVATMASTAAAAYWFMPETGGRLISRPGDLLSISLFVVIGLVIARLNESRRGAEARQRRQALSWQTTLGSIGDGVIVTDREGTITFVNSVAAALTGVRPAEAVGRALGEVFEPRDEATRTPEESLHARVVRDGAVAVGGNRTILVARDGTEHAIGQTAAPIRSGGGPIDGVVLIVRDATKWREERRRREFLAGATATLTSTLEYEATLQRVADLAVPLLADSCAIFLEDEPGAVRLVATAHVDPALRPAMITLASRPDPDRARGWIRAIREGQSELLADVDEERATRILRGDPAMLAAYRQMGITSQLTVPLWAHGRALGAITMTLGPGTRRYGERDLAFAEDVGRVAGVAVDNAALYREAQRREAAAGAARDQATFLADVSAVIASSLDYTETISAATRLVIPRLADFCDVRLLEPTGELRQVAAAHVDREKEALILELGTRVPMTIDTVGPASAHAVRDNRPVLVREVDWEALRARAGGDPYIAAAIDRLRPRSGVVVPLRARGRAIGVLSLFMAESGRTYGDADVPIAEEFARRVATAVENARLYQQTQDSNRLKDEFLATLSHELRTPLNAVLGWSHMLESGQLDARGRERAITGIARNAEAQVKLVEDILDVARGLAGKLFVTLAPIDLVPVVEAAVTSIGTLAAGRRIAIDKHIDRSPVRVDGDEARLHQIVLNVLANAVKFTPDGGRIDVFVTEDAGQAVLRVADTGIGIRADFLPFVFERFRQADASFSRAHTGLGLGLAIVRQLVDLHGGTVTAESDGEGRGAAFTIRVPTRRADVGPDAAAREPAPAGREGALAGAAILLVDDDPDGLELARLLLESRGARVTTAASAAAAGHWLDVRRFDLLILDLSMPGEDGFTLLRRCRARSGPAQRVPAIAFSAHVEEAARERAREAGFDAHVGKPLDADQLIRVAGALVAPRFDTIE